MYPLQRLWHLPLDMWNKLPLRSDLPIPYLQIDIVFVNDPGQIKVECSLVQVDERNSDVWLHNPATCVISADQTILDSACRFCEKMPTVGECTRCRLSSNQDGYDRQTICISLR